MENPIRANQSFNSSDRIPQASDRTQIAAEETIRVLEERLVVDRHKHKVGEVVVRKAIETEIIEVPIRREKLIVEQVSPEHKQLAKIDLGPGQPTSVELADAIASDHQQTVVSSELHSVQAARQLLDAIANLPNSGCRRVRLEFVLDDPSLQATYQDLLTRYAERG